jgi:propionate CoA-transferase
MNLFTRTSLLLHFLEWRLTWNKCDTSYRYQVSGNPKFMSAREAAKMIPDGAVVMTSGLGGNASMSVLYRGIREAFEETQQPRDLALICAGGSGGRGRVPNTVEELGREGLITQFVCGHLETFKAMLKLGDAGKLDIQCLPQGVITMLADGQARGEDSISLSAGVGTFIDPRTGRGTPLTPKTVSQLVRVDGDKLRYTMPKVQVALLNLPAADLEGNIYATDASVLSESREAALAAKANGGLVIVNVGRIEKSNVKPNPDAIFLSRDQVDAVVYYPKTYQSPSFSHAKPCRMLTLNSDVSQAEGSERLNFINGVAGIAPKRGASELVLARLAALVFAQHARPGMFVNVGVGLPEEVCSVLSQTGITDQLTLFTESGVVGGIPAPGVFFGAAICPSSMVGSVEVFRRCYDNELNMTILGALEVDSDGNVNVSKRGEGARNYVGPGGFIDLTCTAEMILFITSWAQGQRIAIENGKLQFVTKGRPKFIDHVQEITFCGQAALRAGKKIFYCTNVGVFQLTSRGMELLCIMPGMDIAKDILQASAMKIVLPADGSVPVVDGSVVTGNNFKVALGEPFLSAQVCMEKLPLI